MTIYKNIYTRSIGRRVCVSIYKLAVYIVAVYSDHRAIITSK